MASIWLRLGTPVSLVLLLCLTSWGASAQAPLDNGVVQIGVDRDGDLNIPHPYASRGGTSNLGLRFMPTEYEATAPGCDCEGWGASYNGSVGGSTTNVEPADIALYGEVGITIVSFTAVGNQAWVTSKVGDLTVHHHYFPSTSPNAYEATVTLHNENLWMLTDVRYRRVMDWDIEPTAFSEHVSIWAEMPYPAALVQSDTNGFESANPLVPVGSFRQGPPFQPSFDDEGPQDIGALFEFSFGGMLPGEKRNFTIFYGAAEDEVTALDALYELGAEVYSLGQTRDEPQSGTPNTFFFGFNGLRPKADFTWIGEDSCVASPVWFSDLTSKIAFSDITRVEWDFDDGAPSPDYNGPYRPTFSREMAKGDYNVTQTVWYANGAKNVTMVKEVRVCVAPEPGLAVVQTTCFRDEVQLVDLTVSGGFDLVHSVWDIGNHGSMPDYDGPYQRVFNVTLAPGTYPVTHVVTDTAGHEVTAVGEVTVCAPVNLPPVVHAPEVLNLRIHEETCFTASGKDPEGALADFVPRGTPGKATVESYGSYMVVCFTPGSADLGRHHMDFVATDVEGLTGLGGTTLVVVRPDLDSDNDGLPDDRDNCPSDPNRGQDDRDRDGRGDACTHDGGSGGPGTDPGGQDDGSRDASSVGTDATPGPEAQGRASSSDRDGDGIDDDSDNCPLTPNRGQENLDGDRFGDLCDVDIDGDGIVQVAAEPGVRLDNCMFVFNPDQLDSDRDGIGDACQDAPAPTGSLRVCPGCVDGPATIPPDAFTRSEEATSLARPVALTSFFALAVICLALGVVYWMRRRPG